MNGKQPCGCVIKDERYVHMCDGCKAMYDIVHLRWSEEHRARHPIIIEETTT